MVPNIFIITCSEQLTAVTMVQLGRGRSHGGGGAGEGAELGRGRSWGGGWFCLILSSAVSPRQTNECVGVSNIKEAGA